MKDVILSGAFTGWAFILAMCGPAVTAAAAQVSRPVFPEAPAGVTAFIDVAVVPMDTERVLPNRTVLVERGRIAALGPVADVEIPVGAARIDGRDKYLIPGLGDCHVHLMMHEVHGVPLKADTVTASQRLLVELLAQGVTVVRNMDYTDSTRVMSAHPADPEYRSYYGKAALALRDQVMAGMILGPRIYTAGQWAPENYIRRLRSSRRVGQPEPRPDSVAAYLAAYQAAGYDFVKVRTEPDIIFDSLAAAARRLGIPVVGHVPPETPLDHALAGMRSIEHLTGYYAYASQFPDTAARLRTLARATERAGVWNCPTLQWASASATFARRFVQALHETGAGLLLGTDQPLGEGVHRELELLVAKVGLTPYQALVTATRNMAAYFNTLHESGTVALGKRADLVLLTGNPLRDIRSAREPVGVMIGGRWFTRAELDRRLAALTPEEPRRGRGPQ